MNKKVYKSKSSITPLLIVIFYILLILWNSNSYSDVANEQSNDRVDQSVSSEELQSKDSTVSVPFHYYVLAFLCGGAGAFVLYFAEYRLDRLAKQLSSRQFRLFIMDIFLFLVAGGFTAAFFVNYDASLYKQAFLIGSTWQGIINTHKQKKSGEK